MKGSVPFATASGNGASGNSCDRSSSHAKNRRNGRRFDSDMIANGPAQHRVCVLECIEHGALGDLPRHVQYDLAIGARKVPEMPRQRHSNHFSVCTSTDNTAGRSRTIDIHESPPSFDA